MKPNSGDLPILFVNYGHKLYHHKVSNSCTKIFLPTDAVAFSSAHFGAGIGPIHLDEVGCTGNEATLISCRHASHQQFQCRYGHWEDAGVRCQSMSHDIYLYWVIHAFVV